MEPVLAIDIGTAYCSAAVLHGRKTETLTLDSGRPLLPSVVTFCEDSILVGVAAKNTIEDYPKRSVFSSLRLLASQKPSLLKTFSSYPFETILTDRTAKFQLGEGPSTECVSPEEVCSRLMKNVINNAESKLKKIQDVTPVVVCIPPSTSFAKRQALKGIAEINGIHIVRFVHSTAAAALKHCIDRHLFNKGTTRLLVLDMGAGNTSVSLVNVDGWQLEVEASSGTDEVGGDTVDDIIHEQIRQELNVSYWSAKSLQSLRTMICIAKQILSSTEETDIRVELSPGKFFHKKISKELVNKLCRKILQETISKHVEKVLADSDIKKEEIDEVLLVGGSADLFTVRSIMENLFKDKEIIYGAQQMAVAGAALYSTLLTARPPKFLKKIQTKDTAAVTLSVEMVGGVLQPLIFPNAAVPFEKEMKLPKELLSSLPSLNIYEGEGTTLDGTLILSISLGDIMRSNDVPSDDLIVLLLQLDETGVFTATLSHQESGQVMSVNVSSQKQELTEKFLFQVMAEEGSMKEKRRAARNAIRMSSALKRKAEECKLEIPIGEEERILIKKHCEALDAWLTANPNADVKTTEAKKREVEALCTSVILQRLPRKND